MQSHSQVQFLCAATWIAGLPFALAAMPDSSGIVSLLEKHAGVDRASLVRAQSGEVVVKLLETKRNSDIAAMGIARIAVPADFFLNQFRDIGSFKERPGVLQVRALSTSPALADLGQLTFSRVDIEAMKTCRRGDCKIKLSAPMLEEIGASATTNAPNVSNLRAARFSIVTRYLAAGDPALI